MSVFINYKICDNAAECSGIIVCPVNTLYWDAVEQTVAIDNKKCLACDACVEACPAGAIRVAHSEKEAVQIQEDIDNDPRTVQDLLVERYGASPVDESTLISVEAAEKQIAKAATLTVIEIIDNSDAPCLINSVPISELFGVENFEYNKVTVGDSEYSPFAKKYSITDCPTLLVFRNGALLVRVDGAVENSNFNQRTNLLRKIRNALNC